MEQQLFSQKVDLWRARAEYYRSDGEEKARAYFEYQAIKDNLDEQTPVVPVAEKLMNMEESFNDLCYWMVKAMGKLNHVSMTISELRALTVYDFYNLRQRLEKEK